MKGSIILFKKITDLIGGPVYAWQK